MTDRAVSVTVNYVLTITIATLLLSLLFVSAGGLIESQTEQTIQSELDILGQQLAADIESADRLATIADGEEAEVEIETRLPNRIAGTGYTIEIDDEIELRSTDPEIVVSVQFNLSDDMDIETDQTVRGGDILIEWDNDVDTLVVKNA